MRRKTLFQVLGSPSEQEGAGAEFNEIWKNDFWSAGMSLRPSSLKVLLL